MLRRPFWKILRRPIGLCLLLCCWVITASGQFFTLNNGTKRVRIPFQLIRNLVIVQLKINDAGPFNFVLDTGVGFMIITEPSLVDSISIPYKRTVKVPGLGSGETYEAFVTPALKIDMPGLTSHNVSAAIFKKDHFGLSRYAGIPIHGLLGYEFFNQLAVKVNFADSLITVCDPKDIRKFKNGIRLPITLEGNKPYIQTNIMCDNGTLQASKLIVDLGAGHPVSLENVMDKSTYSSQFITANLGIGLNGLISGYMGRVKSIDVGKYKVKNVIASFPDDNTRLLAVKRDGNLGVDILKKFTIIFDYTNNSLYLKPSMNFNTPSEHDMSGLEYYAAGDKYKNIIIERVEPGSAGEEAGLCPNDEITSINFKPVSEMNLEQIDQIFKSKDGRNILLDVYRNKAYEKVIITLKRRI